MATIEKVTNDGTYSNLSKREVLQISRQRAKLEKNLGSIADLTLSLIHILLHGQNVLQQQPVLFYG